MTLVLLALVFIGAWPHYGSAMPTCVRCERFKASSEFPQLTHTRARRCLECVTRPIPKVRKVTAEQRLWARVNRNGPIPEARPDLGPCWLWTGPKLKDGYAMLSVNGTNVGVHKFSYELTARIPEGLCLDHLCRVRHCVNPAHLEPVTTEENIRRGELWKVSGAKTKCPAGHPYDAANTCGNEKWRSEERMPWPKEYFELDPRSGCPLSSPTEASIIPARRHIDAE